MFGLKSVYFYLIACQITLIKFFKRLYFSSKNYNKSLKSKTPQQIYYNPNPFLLSIITSYSNQSFKTDCYGDVLGTIGDQAQQCKRQSTIIKAVLQSTSNMR